MTTPLHRRLIPVRLSRDEIQVLALRAIHASFTPEEHQRCEEIENDEESRWLFVNLFRYYRTCGGVPEGLERVLAPEFVKSLRIAFTYHLARFRAAHEIYQRVKGYPREEHKLRA